MTRKIPNNDEELNIQHPGGKRNLSKSATRALDILEYFAMVGRPLRAREISEALDFQASSTDQLLKTMVDSAYLIFDAGDKLYYPSPRLVNFGSWLAANYFGENRIYRLMRSVQEETGDIVTLCIRHGPAMQIVDFIEPIARAGSVTKGSRVSITGSVIGTAFLSLHAEKEVIRIIEQVAGATDEKITVPELKTLLERVNEARSRGYVSGPAMTTEAPWALAVPLPQPASGMKMILGMAGEKASFRAREAELVAIIGKHIQRLLDK